MSQLPSFTQIYQEHAAGVRRLLFRMGVGNDLDDVVQDTFVKIHDKLEEFEGRSSLKTWIYSIAMNMARDHHRRVKRRSWLSFLGQDEYEATGPDRPDQTVSDREQIQLSLGKLSPKLREAVVLSSVQDLDLQEIADVLKVPIGTVKSRLHEARSKLKDFYEKGEALG